LDGIQDRKGFSFDRVNLMGNASPNQWWGKEEECFESLRERWNVGLVKGQSAPKSCLEAELDFYCILFFGNSKG
jgi:hypothetical protein